MGHGHTGLRTPNGMPLIERLLFRTEVDPNSGCWLWWGDTYPAGYGVLTVDGKNEGVHRLGWTTANGPIPKGMCICHRCDTPPCWNPNHLFLGTMGDNAADRHAKGRSGSHKGELNGRAKLSEEEVNIIRKWPKTYGYRKILSDRFGICPTAVSSVRSRKAWASL